MLDYISVLWRPRATFSRLASIKVVRLAGLFILLEFLICMSVFGSYEAQIDKTALTNAQVTEAAKPIMLGIAIAFSTLFTSVLILLTAVVLMLGLYVAGGSARYRDIVGVLFLASIPGLLGKMTRNALHFSGIAPDVTTAGLTLNKFMFATSSDIVNRILACIDVFDIWSFGLVIVGFATISGLRRIPSHAVAALVWGLFFAFQVRIHLLATGPV